MTESHLRMSAQIQSTNALEYSSSARIARAPARQWRFASSNSLASDKSAHPESYAARALSTRRDLSASSTGVDQSVFITLAPVNESDAPRYVRGALRQS